jgi:hypothetical protein
MTDHDGSGIRGETVDEILWLDQTEDPSELGMTRMVSGSFKFVDGLGVFNPRTGGSGITEGQHEILDTLTHWIDETNWQELIRSGGKVTNAIHWETSAKLKKIREVLVTRAGGKVSQIDIVQYNSAGTESQRQVGVITRAGGKVESIQWTKTGSP